MAKLRVRSTLINIVTPKLNEFGFYFDEAASHNKCWAFSRTMNDIVQYIEFDQSDLNPNMLTFFLSTTADRAGMTGTFLAGMNEKRGWTFEDKTSFEEVVREMLQIVIDKGIEWFDISATPIPKPSMEICQLIMENHQSLACNFSEKYSNETTNPMGLKLIEEFFQNTKMRKGTVDWGFIAEASSFLGEVMRIYLGGEWSWDSQFSEPSVVISSEKHEIREYPLYIVLKNCFNPYEPIYDHYRYIKNVLERSTPYFYRTKHL